MLAGGFLWRMPEQALNLRLALPVSVGNHILVPVVAFLYCAAILAEGNFYVKQKAKNPLVKKGFSVGDIGLEPTTFAMSTQRSNQLS